MAWGIAIRNTLLASVLGDCRLSLHTGDPGLTGAAEVTGGSYARQTPTFGAPANATATTTAPVSFTGMPACTVTHAGVWTPAGVWINGGPLGAPQVVNAGNTCNLAAGDVDFTMDP